MNKTFRRNNDNKSYRLSAINFASLQVTLVDTFSGATLKMATQTFTNNFTAE